ncbi:tetratricopeptide repeat protein [Flavobacteriaceae bacterium MAR_2010_72]|nr:tetratricopeptide repeat protein [Flavobacteriaceae bacterium MAR_2010_72]TVZ57609.1 tetratricopeptide repeat protein [Flavobacteriaceae bacterium MAR_2010_105]
MKQLITLTAFLSVLVCFSQTHEIDSLAIQLAYQKQDTVKVKTSVRLIKALYQVKDYKKALLYIDQTEQLSKNLGFIQGSADANYYKALIYTEKDDYYNAIDNYNKAKRYYEQLNNALGIAKVNNNVGLLEIRRGNYISGLNLSLSAIKIFEERQLRQELSKAYNNLAEAYLNTNQIEKALEFNFKALGVREQLQDQEGIKASTQTIAQLYSQRREHRKAIEFYQKLLNLLESEKDAALKGEILPSIGEEYLQFNDYDSAAQYLLEGLQLNRSTNNKDGIIQSLNAIANLNLKLKDIRLAEQQLNEAYDLARTSDNSKELLKNYRLQKEVDSTRGAFESAFIWQSRYYDLKNQMEKSEQRQPLQSNSLSSTNPLETIEPISNDTDSVSTSSPMSKYLLYALIAALLISLTFLILSYTKRNSNHKLVDALSHENKQVQLQNETILKQIADLEEINKVKDRLFSIVSHDLKDSISSIKGFIDLLREEGISREEFYELIPELSENADNASLLLFNLLNWSKTQMQNLEPNPTRFNIQEVFQTKMNLIEQKVEQKRIVLIDESQHELIYADKSMIEIVIQNLLTNAVKFSRVGDVITVSNRPQNGKTIICVEDTGVGIAKENLEKLFKNNAFTTVGTKNEKGTGLGLSICKELVELNQGRIWVESTVNVGTKFFVELPKS